MNRIVRSGLLVAALFCGAAASMAQYYLGPRGGCYTITRSGGKRYVDRSMCESRPAESQQKPVAQAAAAPKPASKYVRGPRGGCYYITAGGTKRYVAHSLCD